MDPKKNSSENKEVGIDARHRERSEDQELLEKVKSDPQGFVKELSMQATTLVGQVANPLYEKIDEKHIGQIIGFAAKHDEREYVLHKNSQDYKHKESVSNRRYGFSIFVIMVVLIVILLFAFKDQPNILAPILTGLGGLFAGGLGGWGLRGKKE